MSDNKPSLLSNFKEVAEAGSGMTLALGAIVLPYALIAHVVGNSTPLIASVAAIVVGGGVFGSILASEKSAGSPQLPEPKP